MRARSLPAAAERDDARGIDHRTRILTLVTFLAWTGQRLGAFAMPFVVLEHTGDAWATGLVAGVVGVAIVTSVWWARPVRALLRTPRSIAWLLLVQAVGAAVVPAAVGLGLAGVGMLIASGGLLGVGAALQTPAVKTVTLADGGSPSNAGALRSLAWQDLGQRLPMTFAPLLGAAMLVPFGSLAPVALQSVLLVVAALSIATLAPPVRTGEEASPSGARVRDVLRGRPVITAALVLSLVAGLCWFALPLGLALLGVERGSGGALAAAALTGYGVATVLSSLLAPRWAARLVPVPFVFATWALLGGATVTLPAVAAHPWALAIVAGVGGCLVPFGNAAFAALVASLPDDAARHTAFTLHLACYSGGTSIGLLVGGVVMAATGAVPAIVAAGGVLLAATLIAVVLLRVTRPLSARKP